MTTPFSTTLYITKVNLITTTNLPSLKICFGAKMKTYKNLYKDKKILITGAYGFIGSYLLDKLSKDNLNISVIDIKKSKKKYTNVKEYIGDLNDKNFVKSVISKVKPNIIFHLAADKNRSRDIEILYSTINNNLISSLNLFTEALNYKIDSIVTLSTAEEYGINTPPFKESYREAPISPYSFSKTCLTHLCQTMHKLYKLPVTILRPAIAYGYGQGIEMFIPALIDSLVNNKNFKMTKGSQKRDFIYIDDLINAIIKASISKKAIGEIINIGSGNPILLKDLALLIADKLNKKNYIKLGELPYRKNEIMDYVLDIQKAKNIINWLPEVNLEKGIDIILKKYREKQ
jgi:UDP-glucose 4-epimerase